MPGLRLVSLIKKTISKLHISGLRVANFSSDQGGNFSKLLSLFKISQEKPYFEHNGFQIIVTPDPPHLLKLARNCLVLYTIKTAEGNARWEHIRRFYEMEKNQLTRMAPRLTDEHIDLPPIYAKMNVRFAAQVRIISNIV